MTKKDAIKIYEEYIKDQIKTNNLSKGTEKYKDDWKSPDEILAELLKGFKEAFLSAELRNQDKNAWKESA